MSIDLSQFHQVFYEESFEGLDVMEAALMELDLNNIDDETINAIFRSAHSIKGGSATFGFSSVSEFTHDLETILDQVRSGKRQFRDSDINICLKSVDCMREMLQLLQAGEDGHTKNSAELKDCFARMLAGEQAELSQAELSQAELSQAELSQAEPLQADLPQIDVPTAAPETTEALSQEAPANVAAEDGVESIWRINFEPSEDILRTGNDVARMFRELAELGQLLSIETQSNLPPFNVLDAEKCYLSWTILFACKKDKCFIEEVFEWVADESNLEVTPAASAQEWHICFVPGENILRSGNEPSRLLNVLSEFGKLHVRVNDKNLPAIRLMDHESCYLSWDIYLHAEQALTEEAIREVFEWVLDESQLSVSRLASASSANEITAVSEVPQAEVAEPADVVPLGSVQNTSQEQQITTPETVQEKPKSKTAVQKKNTETGSIRVGIDKVDNLINMVGELVITQSMLGQLGTEFDVERIPKLMEGLGQLEQNTRELQESVMRIRMLPISFAFSRFPRMVRDLGQSLGKELQLVMIGEQTELDKTVMEKIGDPLVHLVRNAVDHGIEQPEEREASGKPRSGTITLNAYHQGGNVVIEISDDGKGLDKQRIVEKALEKGLITKAEVELLTDEHAFDLIFQPGFSTAQEVSDVSGRGVGMDVVRRNIQALNGTVEINSQKDQGSKITIRLPLTLAILDGQLVRVGTNTYIFPLVSIVESLQYRKELISSVAGGCNVFKLRDDYVPIIELHKIFSVQADSDYLDQALMVVVESDGEKVGIVVDELLAQQQVVIKSLEQNYKRVEGISGATILGDGTVALILDTVGMVKLAGDKFGMANQLAHLKNDDHQNLSSQLTG
ncbi:two-component system, chemotaxis family, sensor kinase CheA [Alteromonadaceae bacterium Bs31]|nr:two-component system, chemotaxis family, sensor kinase CheA [Alteromonadaceae bacterium Bs31]